MLGIKTVRIDIVMLLLMGLASATCVFTSGRELRAQPRIHIEIPVTLKKTNVVFNIGHADFAGDMPTGIRCLHLLATRFKEVGTEGRIIGIFYREAAYPTLNDKAYNAYRLVETGNPYKNVVASLMEQYVQIEACAISMKAHGWGNQDLLPGVKVNTGAVGGLIQLV